MKDRIKKIVNCSFFVAIYVIVCFILQAISFGPFQFRFSELLCLFAIDYLWAYIGVILGCFLANLFIGGLGVIDVFFGTLATIIGCGSAYLFRHRRYKDYPLISILLLLLLME